VANDPDKAVFHERAAGLLSMLGDKEEAISQYTKAIEVNRERARLYHMRGQLYARLAKERNDKDLWTKANDDYADALRKPGTTAIADLYARRAETLEVLLTFASDKTDLRNELVRVYSDAIRENRWADKSLGDLYEKRATVYRDLQRRGEAIEDYLKAAEIFVNVTPMKAIQTYQETLKLDAQSWKPYAGMAKAWTKAHQWSKALENCAEALKRNPEHVWSIQWDKGHAHAALGAWGDAIKEYSSAIDLEPNNIDLRRDRGLAYTRTKQWNQALADFDVVLNTKPGDWQTWSNRASVCSSLRQWGWAAADYSKALESATAPSKPFLYRNRGIAFAEADQWQKAAADFAATLKQAHFDSSSWYLLALAQLANNDEKGYRQTCADMLRQFGNTTSFVDTNRAAWTCALAPARTRPLDPAIHLDPAIDLAKRAIAQSPPDAHNHNTLGMLYYRVERYEEAISEIEQSIKLRTQPPPKKGIPAAPPVSSANTPASANASVYDELVLAMAYHARRQLEKAHEHYKIAVKLMDDRLSSPPGAPSYPTWQVRLEWRLFRSEVEELFAPGTGLGEGK
jgi:tetratricopeptide (TPR) repeat protein